ncbi:MAG TPA: hypothetical protein VFX60_16465 [Micromonospora sp.]|nr:hypothetical protein [Micromonospora sp.]
MSWPPSPQTPPPPALPKKSTAGKILLIVLAVVLVACVGGGAAAYLLLKDDVQDLFSAPTTRVIAPEALAGWDKNTDARFQSAIDQMVESIKTDLPEATNVVSGLYGDPAQEDMILVAAASVRVINPEKKLEEAFRGAAVSDVGDVTPVDPGPLGGYAKCGDAEASSTPIAMCMWTDRGSFGMVFFYFRTADEVQEDFLKVRAGVQQRS